MMSIISFLFILLTLRHVSGECSYYAQNPMDTCIEGSSVSNFYYCDANDYIHWQQFGNGDCTAPAAYDNVLCNPSNASCLGNCGGDPCSYISMISYGESPCDKSTDDWTEEPYIMDYCHAVSLSQSNSLRWQCSDIGILSYTTFTDDACTYTLSTTTTAVQDLAETECQDAIYVSTDCNFTVYDPTSNIECAHHGSRPLNACKGQHEAAGTDQSTRFTCNSDEELVQEAYANLNCSGDPAYQMPLCDSRFSECFTRCGGEMCDYFIQRGYKGSPCDTSGDYTEVVRPIGYCVYESETLSRIAECNDKGGITYTQWNTDGACQGDNPTVYEFELSGYPTMVDGGCTHTYLYVNCPVPQTTTEEPTTTEEEQPTTEEPEEYTTTEEEQTTTEEPEEPAGSGSGTYRYGIVIVFSVIGVLGWN